MSCCCTSRTEVKKNRGFFFPINDLFILGGKNSSLGGVKKNLMLSRASASYTVYWE